MKTIYLCGPINGRTDDGRIVTTFELPTAVLCVFSRKRLQAQIDAFNRGEERRAVNRNVIAVGVFLLVIWGAIVWIALGVLG